MMMQMVTKEDDFMTLEQWDQNVRFGTFNEYDGSGAFVYNNGMFEWPDEYNVFMDAPPYGAIGVVWFNK